ncbi:MAG: SpoIID/LytB domain-containing protein [Nitriliruptoraceae bacterium]
MTALHSMRERFVATLFGAALIASTVSVPAQAVEDAGSVSGGTEGADSDGAAEGSSPQPLPLDGPPRFVVADGEVFDVAGRGRYYDTLDVLPLTNRTLLVNELSMDDYIAGIAEMPTSWPMEALKAQAVAARTYAWRAIQRASYDGYDICATVACQVFKGADVVLGRETGNQWREAVNATSDEVLLDADGRPILARYFSTSGGRTYANEEVFPSSGAFDYLVGIDDPYDAVSPLHKWHVTFTRDEFDAIIARGDTLSAAAPVASVERLGAIDDPLAQVRVTGQNGVVVDVGVVAFRDFVSRMSAMLYPAQYPGPRADGQSRLPATMPSSRFDIAIVGDDVVVDGQGWGHGVGMGQYGARARATAGADYDEILGAYYNGRLPTVAEVPDRVRVGMTADLPLRIGATTVFDILVGDQTRVDDALGTWEVARTDDGWTLTPPVGFGEPLVVTPTRIVAETRPEWGATTVEATVNTPAFLRLEVHDASGAVVAARSLGVVDAGTHRARWPHDDEAESRVEPGDYRARIVARDRTGDEAGEAVTVTVPAPPRPPDPEPPAGDDEPATTPDRLRVGMVVALAVGAVGVLLLLLALLIRGRR